MLLTSDGKLPHCLCLARLPLLDSFLEITGTLLHGIQLHITTHGGVVIAMLLHQVLSPLPLPRALLPGDFFFGSRSLLLEFPHHSRLASSADFRAIDDAVLVFSEAVPLFVVVVVAVQMVERVIQRIGLRLSVVEDLEDGSGLWVSYDAHFGHVNRLWEFRVDAQCLDGLWTLFGGVLLEDSGRLFRSAGWRI